MFLQPLLWVVSTCKLYRAWMHLPALIILKVVRVCFWNDEPLQWIWPRTQASLGDLDQVMASLNGVILLISYVYLAYLRYRKEKQEGVAKKMVDQVAGINENKVLDDGIGGPLWERAQSDRRFSDAMKRFGR